MSYVLRLGVHCQSKPVNLAAIRSDTQYISARRAHCPRRLLKTTSFDKLLPPGRFIARWLSSLIPPSILLHLSVSVTDRSISVQRMC